MHTEQADNIATLLEWEYRCEPRDGFHEFEKTLNRAGEEHWELVSVVINNTGMVYPVFKRPKPCRKTHQATGEQTEPQQSG